MAHIDAATLNPGALQSAVDGVTAEQVIGGLDNSARIVGIDVVPGIVVGDAAGELEAPAVVYLEGPSRHSMSRRAKVLFRLVQNQIVVERIVMA